MKADAKKSEDEMTETFMSQLKETEDKLSAKNTEAEKSAKEIQRLSQELKQSDLKI